MKTLKVNWPIAWYYFTCKHCSACYTVTVSVYTVYYKVWILVQYLYVFVFYYDSGVDCMLWYAYQAIYTNSRLV